MHSIYRDWRDYQNAVAVFFRERGCAASVEARVSGARATHTIDVYVTFHQHGIECRWVAECKLWRARVKKENVLALKSILDDVGADRGIIFCENGFQTGAQDAARYTNILLVTSFEEFKRTVLLNEPRVQLIQQVSDQPGTPPVHAFPNGDQPQHLLAYGGRVFVANWETGNIAVVDPESKAIESVVHLDKYEVRSKSGKDRIIGRYQPGDMACADRKLFVGQVFSDFILVIDIDTQSIVRRISVPGGGEGAIAGSLDGRYVYFASNRANCLFVIDSATYEYQQIDYPAGGRGSMCVLPHPSRPLVYIGIQRGSQRDGRALLSGNCFLATYDMAKRRYIGHLDLAEVEDGPNDAATPACLTFDEEQECLFVGMFQSKRGICRIDELGREILENIRFAPTNGIGRVPWVDPLSQALDRGKLLSVNRNNCELVTLDKRSGRIEQSVFLGDAPNGPRAVVVVKDAAVVSYPARRGLIFQELERR